MVIFDLEKTYDKVPKNILWKALEKKKDYITYIQIINDMYNRATNVRTQE